jgi:regulator of CtrA degradation
MLLADEARAYFDVVGRAERESLEALSRVTFSCESLKVTTRLMHIIAWLLTQRAVEAGELTPIDARSPSRRLGDAPESEAATLEAMPTQARSIITTSIELHRRVARLDASLDEPTLDESAADDRAAFGFFLDLPPAGATPTLPSFAAMGFTRPTSGCQPSLHRIKARKAAHGWLYTDACPTLDAVFLSYGLPLRLLLCPSARCAPAIRLTDDRPYRGTA